MERRSFCAKQQAMRRGGKAFAASWWVVLALVLFGTLVSGQDCVCTREEVQTIATTLGNGGALGDVNGDEWLDLYITIEDEEASDVLLINNGDGTFTQSNQTFGTDYASFAVAMGDLNNDTFLDIFVTTTSSEPNAVWLNNGDGTFALSQELGRDSSSGVVLVDLNGDGALDAFVTNIAPVGNKVFLNTNNGTGLLVDSGQTLGDRNSFAVAIADLNNDTTPDAFVCNFNDQPDEVRRMH
ncbi:DUF642 domain-containing protein [Balamuthia mandrillaris]